MAANGVNAIVCGIRNQNTNNGRRFTNRNLQPTNLAKEENQISLDLSFNYEFQFSAVAHLNKRYSRAMATKLRSE